MFYKYKRIIIAAIVIVLSVVSFGVINFLDNSKFISGNSSKDAVSSNQNSKVNSDINSDQKPQKILESANVNNKKTVDNNSDSSSINSNSEVNSGSSNEQNNTKNQTVKLADGGSFNVSYTADDMVNYNTKNIIKNNDINVNYNENLVLKSGEKNQNNQNNDLVFKINNAKLLSKNQLVFNLEIIKNENFKGLNVIAIDNFGNSLEVNPSIESKGNNIVYKVNLINPNTKSVHIEVQNEFNTAEQQGCQVTLDNI
ncbi:MAG: hypothetical protein ACRDCW_07645 [Sarcina sp.]